MCCQIFIFSMGCFNKQWYQQVLFGKESPKDVEETNKLICNALNNAANMTTVLATSCTLHFYSENNKVILVNNFPWNWLSTGSFVGVVVGGPLDNQYQVL